MIERLQRAIEKIEHLPPEVQDEAANQLEVLAEPFEAHQASVSLAGAWRDLPDADTMIDELDRLRHSVPPTPPLEDDDL
jgi:uncharacterized protein (DUF2342 family)